MKKSFLWITVCGIATCTLFSCSQTSSSGESRKTAVKNDWAKTAVSSPSALSNHSRFYGLTAGQSGSMYAAGSLTGPAVFSFGNNVSAQIPSIPNNRNNALIVKYTDRGAALWARVPVIAPNPSRFYASATDATGNVYAAGYAAGTESFKFGAESTEGGSESYNCLLVKYDASGVVQWAKISGGTPNEARFFSVTVDHDGNIYAAGYVEDGMCDFGNGKTENVTGIAGILVKYDANGDAQWVKLAPESVLFYTVVTDNVGNLYVSGYLSAGENNFGNSVIATGFADNENAVVVKYNSSGTALLAISPSAADTNSRFYAVAIDNAGNIFAAGSVDEGTVSFGEITAADAVNSENAVIAKFAFDGKVQWIKTAAGNNKSVFTAVFADSTGNVYAAGGIDGILPFNFGNSITLGGSSVSNCAAVKYNTSGTAQWAFTGFGTNDAAYNAIIESAYGQVFAAGIIDNGYFNFGNGNWITADAGVNAVLVKYCQ